MNSLVVRFAKHIRVSSLSSSSHELGMPRISALWYSTSLSGSDNDELANDNLNDDWKKENDERANGNLNDDRKKEELDGEFDDFLGGSKPELELQGVDPKRGWGFRGVHKAIICGKVGQAPVQKILRNGNNVTIFTVGTGGMYDQRTVGAIDLPKPAQWHRIAVHNNGLGAYAVQQLFKNSSVYVEGDIETRVYNDSINGEVKSIPEICVRRDGKIHLIKSGESIDKSSLEELREGLF